MDIYGRDRGTTLAKIQSGQTKRIAGPGTSSLKYDVLTALLATATSDVSSTKSRLALRLSLVITARYNWKTAVFNVGLRELARMWGVTERTAKREIAQMRALGWISVERSAARGRVARYEINFHELLAATAQNWDAVGSDFKERMSGTPEDTPANVVPLHADTVPIPAEDGTDWPKVAATLQAQDPTIFASWFARLNLIETESGVWVFQTATQFEATYIKTHLYGKIFAAVAAQDRSARKLEFVAITP